MAEKIDQNPKGKYDPNKLWDSIKDYGRGTGGKEVPKPTPKSDLFEIGYGIIEGDDDGQQHQAVGGSICFR